MAKKKGKVRFVRIRGRIIPIRQRVANSLDSASSLVGVASIGSFSSAAVARHPKVGFFRAKVALGVTRGNFTKSGIRKIIGKSVLTAPVKFGKIGIALGTLSSALSVGSAIIDPETKFNDVLNILGGK